MNPEPRDLKDSMDFVEKAEARLSSSSEQILFRGIEQLARAPEVENWAEDEFPHRKDLGKLDRRNFLKVMGASLALAGLGGCRFQGQRKIVPFVQSPEDYVPGSTQTFASSCELGGYSTGVLVTSYEGRPIRIDGNPQHPASLGSLDSKSQAELLNMYDPDRLKAVQYKGDPSTWQEFDAAAVRALKEEEASGGSGIGILTQTVGSPSLRAQLEAFQARYPNAKWYQWEPVNRDAVFAGSRLAFGRDLEPKYDFSKVDVFVSLDSRVLSEEPGFLRYAKDLADRRDLRFGNSEMSRIYSFDSAIGEVGILADHRYPVRPSQMIAVAQALASALGIPGAAQVPAPRGVEQKVIDAIARELLQKKGRSLVCAGYHLPAEVHAIVGVINLHLQNTGQTVDYIEPLIAKPGSQQQDFRNFAGDLERGTIRFLLVVSSNPVYTAFAESDLAKFIEKVPFSASANLYEDETSQVCQWNLPVSHFLEAWSDGRAYDGTLSIVQPLIQPLYDSRSELEIFDALLAKSRPGLDIVRAVWNANYVKSEAEWNDALARGYLLAPVQTAEITRLAGDVLQALRPAPASTELEVLFAPDPAIYDGRFANNGWLQELPKAFLQVCWDNAAFISYNTAKRLGIPVSQPLDGYFGSDWIELKLEDRSLRIPCMVHLGLADETVLIHLGYGREAPKLQRATGAGWNAYRIRSWKSPWLAASARVTKAGGRPFKLALTQYHHTVDTTEVDSGRNVIQTQTLSSYRSHQSLMLPTGEEVHEPHVQTNATKQHLDDTKHERELEKEGAVHESTAPTLYDPAEHDWSEKYNQWGMTIDLNLCIACNACVTACQAENNIPVVGKGQVLKGREMQWIRVDRYYTASKPDDLSNPSIHVQPVTCMHCEAAPCEPVCPVAATIHSHEGLNMMVYNRCVGTRYCSNNCPYKVRRFNFLNYANKHDVPVHKLLNNPDVTVRGRGVMEKCTYCVQRISKARIKAKEANRPLTGEEIKTACQVACPTNAIVFGDIREKDSPLGKTRSDSRNYVLLEELNTKPRTTYLGKVTNPNPELVG